MRTEPHHWKGLKEFAEWMGGPLPTFEARESMVEKARGNSLIRAVMDREIKAFRVIEHRRGGTYCGSVFAESYSVEEIFVDARLCQGHLSIWLITTYVLTTVRIELFPTIFPNSV